MAAPISNNNKPAPAPARTPTPNEAPKLTEAAAADAEPIEDISWATTLRGAAEESFASRVFEMATGGPFGPLQAYEQAHDIVGGAVDAGRVLLSAANAQAALSGLKPGEGFDVTLRAKVALAQEGIGAGGATAEKRVTVDRTASGSFEVSSSTAAGVYASLGDHHAGVESKDVLTTTVTKTADDADGARALLRSAELGMVADVKHNGPRFDDTQARRADFSSAASVTLDGTLSAEMAAKVGLGELFGAEMEAELKGGLSVGFSSRVDPQKRELTFERHAGAEAGIEQTLGIKKKLGSVDVVERQTYKLPPDFDLADADNVVALAAAARRSTPMGPPSTTIGVGGDSARGELTLTGVRARDAVQMLASGEVPPGVTVEGRVERVAVDHVIGKPNIGPAQMDVELGSHTVLSSRDVESVSQFKKEMLRASLSLDMTNRLAHRVNS